MHDNWLRELERDPDGTWHALRQQAFPYARRIRATAFGRIVHESRPERGRILIELAQPARRIIVPSRYWATDGVEEVRIVWPGGAVSVPLDDITVRQLTGHQLLLALPPYW
jgi:hypothetical protein